MERFQKKLNGLSLETILNDRDMLILAVLLIILISQKADLPLVLAVAYILLF
ncbi:MAG: hypothetical protein FWG44_00425 [Oscillospiraceae bacterium]|nr:hypothetical protein [Oscillospiraceae bacterium]